MESEPTLTKLPVVILGGGISGLSVAWFLQKAGIDFRLIEKEAFTGGKIRSEISNGAVFDYGPNSIRDKTGIIHQLIDDLSLREDVVEISEAFKTRYIVRKGKLSKIGPDVLSTISTDVLSRKGKIRLLKEPFIPAGPVQEESIGSFLRRRLGDEVVDYLADPIFSGIYAGNIDKLSKTIIMPELAEKENKYGSLTKGSLISLGKTRKSERKKRPFKVLNFKKGVQQLTSAMTSQMRSFIVQDEVLSLDVTEGGFKIKTQHSNFLAQKVISCLPAYALAEILHGNVFTVLSQTLQKIQYTHLLTTQVVYKKSAAVQTESGFGFLVPQLEKLNLLGAIWKSSIFPQLTDDDKVHFTLMSGGAMHRDTMDRPIQESEKRVLEDFTKIMGIHEEPVMIKSHLWENAVPQFNVGFKLLREKIESEAQHIPGLFIGANYMWGVSVSECVEGAHKLVKSENLFT